MAAPPRQLSASECAAALSDHEVVEAMARAFELAHVPGVARCQMSTASGADLVFGHASVLPGLGLCVKAGIQVPGNKARGVDPVQAAVALFDADTGEPRAFLDGGTVTVLRTAGALIAGIRAVGAPSRPRVAVIGWGAQARTVARMATTVLGAEEVRVYARTPPELPGGYLAAASVAAAVEGADVVACCTTATEPVVTADQVAPGAVIASMGSYGPELCEIDPEIVRRSALVAADVPPSQLGPVTRLDASVPGWVDLGRPVVESRDLRTVFVGGTGVEDACAAWSVLLGWPAVDAITRHYTQDPSSTPSAAPRDHRGTA